MANQKLTEQELKDLKFNQNQSSDLTYQLGQIDMQKSLLDSQRDEILGKITDLQEKQNNLAKELQDKYGQGNINLETGEFTKEEDSKTVKTIRR